MGIDYKLQAFPEDAALLRLASVDPAQGELLGFFAMAARAVLAGAPWRPWPLDADESRFFAEVRALVERDPDIVERNAELGRGWYRLTEPLGAAETAFRCAGALGVASGTQGIPVRWSTPAQVVATHEFLSSVTDAELCDALDSNVHDLLFDEQDGAPREWVVDVIAAMRAFYADAVGCGYGALCFAD